MIMQKLIIIVIVFTAACFFACNDNKEEKINNKDEVLAGNTKTSPLEGSWNLVWKSGNESFRREGKVTQFKMFSHGYFSLIGQDSTGKSSWAGAGTYTVEGNMYKEIFLYCTIPEYVGATDWQEFEMNGDTLSFKGFKKAILADGKDVTNQFEQFEEKRVRAN
jgi:hypothetical protein